MLGDFARAALAVAWIATLVVIATAQLAAEKVRDAVE